MHKCNLKIDLVLPTTTTEIKHKIGAVLEDGRKGRNSMDENKEMSTISVAVELEGLDQVNEELDKMLNKLEKANSLADELTSKLKTYGIDGNEIARTVSETIRGKASITR